MSGGKRSPSISPPSPLEKASGRQRVRGLRARPPPPPQVDKHAEKYRVEWLAHTEKPSRAVFAFPGRIWGSGSVGEMPRGPRGGAEKEGRMLFCQTASSVSLRAVPPSSLSVSFSLFLSARCTRCLLHGHVLFFSFYFTPLPFMCYLLLFASHYFYIL